MASHELLDDRLAARVDCDARPDARAPTWLKAIPALVRCLSDREGEVRRSAAYALGQLGPEASVAVPNLTPLTESDPDERVRRTATLSRSILLRRTDGEDHAP